MGSNLGTGVLRLGRHALFHFRSHLLGAMIETPKPVRIKTNNVGRVIGDLSLAEHPPVRVVGIDDSMSVVA